MSAPCIVREARHEDMDALVELLGMLFSIEADFSVDAGRQCAGLELMLKPGQARLVLVAVSSGGMGGDGGAKVIGMATAQMLVSTAEGGPALLVEDVVVRPESRGRGVGRALVSRVEDWGKRLGATRLQLLTDKDNEAAFAFYGRCGFARTNLVCLRRTLP